MVFSDGAVAGAELVGRCPTYDLAVIRLRAHIPLLDAVGDSDAARSANRARHRLAARPGRHGHRRAS